MEVDLQHHLLKMMVNSESLLAKVSMCLKEEYFDNPVLGWFCKFIYDYYEDFKKTPEFSTIKNEILKFDVKDRPKYDRVLEKIEASEYSDEEYLLQQLTGWLRSRKFIKLHKEVATIFNGNNQESAYEFTSRHIRELQDLNLTVDRTIDFNELDSVIKRASEAHIYRIPIGIPEIDEALRGGLPRQTLTNILGYTNTGKTIMLINIAYNAILNKKKVLFIYHEGPDDQITLRFLSRMTKIPYGKFFGGMSCMTQDERMQINQAKIILNERLILKPWQKFDATVEDVIAYCRKKKSEFDYDLVIDDYGQILLSKSKSKKDELRHSQAAVYRALAQTAAELNVAFLSAVQTNRAIATDIAKGDRLIGLNDVAECFEIMRASECVLTITRSHKDIANNRLKILLAKQRDGQTNVGADCKTDYDRMILYDRELGIDSIRLTDGHKILQNNDEQSFPLVQATELKAANA